MRNKMLQIRESFWFIPAVLGVLAILLAQVLISLDHTIEERQLRTFGYFFLRGRCQWEPKHPRRDRRIDARRRGNLLFHPRFRYSPRPVQRTVRAWCGTSWPIEGIKSSSESSAQLSCTR